VDAGEAEAFEEGPRIGAKGGDEDGKGKWNGGGAPDPLAGTHVEENERELHRTQEVIHRLQNRLVKAEAESNDEVEERGETEKRQERTSGADGERECELVGRDALGELRAERCDEAALP
jgi:hypothetical protein